MNYKILLFKKSAQKDNYGKNTYQNGVERYIKLIESDEINNEDLSEDDNNNSKFLMKGYSDVKTGDYFSLDITVPIDTNPESIDKDNRYRVLDVTRISIGRRQKCWGELGL